MKLKDVRKRQFGRGETYYTEIGIPLLTHAGTGKVLEKRHVSSTAYVRSAAHGIELVLFETVIATFLKKGGMQLDSGGWRTRFTRHIMSDLLPVGYRLVSDGGLWVFMDDGTGGIAYADGCLAYADGCVVHETGKVTGAATRVATLRQRRLLDKSRRFAKRFIDQFMAGKTRAPGAGDCFYCQAEMGSRNVTFGVLTAGGTRPHATWEAGDHVRAHVAEGYFVPSMLVNSCQAAYGSIPMPVKMLFQWFWGQEGKAVESGVSDACYSSIALSAGQRQLTLALRAYLRRHCGAEFGGKGWQSRPVR